MMHRINLLPWREEQRKERQRQFLVMLGGAAFVAVLVVLYAHIHVSGMISAQEKRNDFIEQEIAKADAKIREIRQLEAKKSQLLARMEVIQTLQSQRARSTRLFNGMVQTLPDGLYYTRLRQTGNALSLEGIAESNARVSDLMRRFDRSNDFAGPRLDVIQARDEQGERVRSFNLRVTQVTTESAEAQ